MSLPSDYKIADGCWNCHHSFLWVEQDEDTEFFCCQDGLKRPLCGSNCLGESFTEQLRKEGAETGDQGELERYEKLSYEWEEWSKLHKVQESDRCSLHKIKEKK